MLAQTIMYLGNSVIPKAGFVTSKMQQHLEDLGVEQIIEGNDSIKKIELESVYQIKLTPMCIKNKNDFTE